jgi:hypothetical protein
MPDHADAFASLVASVFSVAKDVTVTGLLLWFVRMLLTGDVVRKSELEAANKRTDDQATEARYWRDQFHAERQTAREAVASLRETIETALRVRDDKVRRG